VFLVLGTQHTMHIRYIVFCGLPNSNHFSTFSHKWHDFEKTY